MAVKRKVHASWWHCTPRLTPLPVPRPPHMADTWSAPNCTKALGLLRILPSHLAHDTPSVSFVAICRRLEKNNLQGNALVQLATSLPHLADLALSDNALDQLPDVRLFAGRRWERLDLRHNQLTYEDGDGSAAGWVRPIPLYVAECDCIHH